MKGGGSVYDNMTSAQIVKLVKAFKEHSKTLPMT